MWRLSSHLRLRVSSFFQIVKLLALSTFEHSYAIHFWVYLSQLDVERTDLASQNHNFILVRTWSAHSARTNQRLKSADLRHRQKNEQKTRLYLGAGPSNKRRLKGITGMLSPIFLNDHFYKVRPTFWCPRAQNTRIYCVQCKPDGLFWSCDIVYSV